MRERDFPLPLRPELRSGPKVLLQSDDELAYWVRELRVSEKQLRAAVRAVGHDLPTVMEYLTRCR